MATWIYNIINNEKRKLKYIKNSHSIKMKENEIKILKIT